MLQMIVFMFVSNFDADIYVIRERDKNARLIRIAPQLPTASSAAHDPFALHLQPEFIPLDTSVTPAAPVHLFPMVLHSSSSSSSSALVSSKPAAPLGFSVLASASDSGALSDGRQSCNPESNYLNRHSFSTKTTKQKS